MAFDPFDSVTDNLISPARNAFSILPDDTIDLPSATKAVYVGTGGDIAVQLIDSEQDVVFSNVPTGSILAIRIVAVRANGTTASNLVGLA
jgi:hypothetical protein